MRKLNPILVLLLTSFFGYAQDYHGTADVLKIMEKSPVTYEIGMIKEPIPAKDRSMNLNFNHFYRSIEDGNITTKEYEITEDLKIYLDKAEDFFMDKKFENAREMYLKALEVDTGYYMVMTYIGQTYGIKQNWAKAIEWYQKTIKKNYIDYMAHWFLADAYVEVGKLDEAVDEITIALILNRNNPRILTAFNAIYKAKKLEPTSWVFNPQMELDSIAENTIKLNFRADWTAYAMTKALWKYEPGYSESMGVAKGNYSTVEETECLINLMSTLDKKKIKKNPELKALKAALENKFFSEYIIFEIILQEHPFTAYQLSEDFIASIKDYILTVRGEQ